MNNTATALTSQNALGYISLALRMLNVLPQGQNPDGPMQQDAFFLANLMMDGLNSEQLMLFTEAINYFNLSVGQQVYTCGPGGNFNIPRPPKIAYASVVILTNPFQPLELAIPIWTDAQWQQYQIKNLTSTFPLGIWDDNGFPLRSLTYWPVPQQVCGTRLYVPTALSQFQDLVTYYTFPPQYARMILYNLAVELSSGGFGGVLTAAIAANAVSSKALVKSSNIKPYYTACDPAFMGRDQTVQDLYDWRTNRPVGNP